MREFYRVLVRTDKNGTQYYRCNKCRKCGGTGHLDCYNFIESGRCFKCDGFGVEDEYIEKVMTPEHQQELWEKRKAKYIKESAERNKKFFKQIGFNEDGECWMVMGDTYDIREELKSHGAKFDSAIGWHFAGGDNGYECIKLTFDDVFYYDDFGTACFQQGIYDKIDEIKKKYAKEHKGTVSEHIGTVGEVVEVVGKFVGVRSYTNYSFSYYGTTEYMYRFVDGDGNVVVWKTTSSKDFEKDKEYKFKGTVKFHDEYDDEKRTILVKCKFEK